MSRSYSAIKAGVIGWPIAHSLSPHLHGHWLQDYQIDGTYEPFAVEPEEVSGFLQSLPDRELAGVNVTLPHKVAALDAVDEADDVARRIGAVNTIVVREDGSLQGSNTDAFGFIENISDVQPGWDATAGPAVVLGAGGAARAVCVALQDAGAPEIRLLNRTREKAEALAKGLGNPLSVQDWEARNESLSEAALLVNTTSLGMKGMDPLALDLKALPERASVCDIVYTPLETQLLADAKASGNRTIDGLGMLLHQARPGFEAWFGQAPQVTDDLRRVVLTAMGH